MPTQEIFGILSVLWCKNLQEIQILNMLNIRFISAKIHCFGFKVLKVNGETIDTIFESIVLEELHNQTTHFTVHLKYTMDYCDGYT